MTDGFTLWFTGLSGAGKSTCANIVAEKLRELGRKVEILDGDELRQNISQGAGFSKEDRNAHIRRVAYIAKLLSRNEVISIIAAISPYKDLRSYAREINDNFIEVYTKCSLDVLIERDTKGLYKKAIKGEIDHFTGISDPYEEPEQPEIIIETDKETVEESVEKILDNLERLKFILR